jgi:hypothetical protein
MRGFVVGAVGVLSWVNQADSVSAFSSTAPGA